MVAGEVVGRKEQEHPAAGLVADGGGLVGPFGPGQDQARAAARRLDRDPALAALVDVFGQPEAKRADVEGDGRVIVGHDQGEGGNAGWPPLQPGLSGRLIRATCSAIGSTDRGCRSAQWLGRIADRLPLAGLVDLQRREAGLVAHLAAAGHPVAKVDVGQPRLTRDGDVVEDDMGAKAEVRCRSGS